MIFIILLGIMLAVIILWIILKTQEYFINIPDEKKEFWDEQVKIHNIEDEYLAIYLGYKDPYDDLEKGLKEIDDYYHELYRRKEKRYLMTPLSAMNYHEEPPPEKPNIESVIIKLALNPRTKLMKTK